MGPDDLVHVVKNIPNSRQQIKEVNLNFNDQSEIRNLFLF